MAGDVQEARMDGAEPQSAEAWAEAIAEAVAVVESEASWLAAQDRCYGGVR